MVGTPPRRTRAIDQFGWGRRALVFVGMSELEHDRIVEKVGASVVGGILFLAITRFCGTDQRRWSEARNLGIP